MFAKFFLAMIGNCGELTEWLLAAQRRMAIASFAVVTLCWAPTVHAHCFLHRTYAPVNVYDPTTNTVVAAYQPAMNAVPTYLPVTENEPVTGTVAATAYTPVTAYEPVTMYRPVTTYKPVTAYRLVTAYQPMTTYQPVTSYQPVMTYKPVTTYAQTTTYMPVVAETVAPAVVLRPVFVSGQPIRNTWRALNY